MYKAAKDHMEKINADFVVTGEVLFQRPMSQNNRALHIIEDEAELKGKVLRPLSAKHLPTTEAEKNGLVKRDSMGDIKGRSRKGQLALAKQFGVAEPPNAAGGCLLTDPAFSVRIRDLMDHTDGLPSLNDVDLLKVGRHFRLDEITKLIVGRNHEENEVVKALAIEHDAILEARDCVGPTCLLRSTAINDSLILQAAAITLRYSDSPRDKESVVRVTIAGKEKEFSVFPAENTAADVHRI
jgi:tRNA-uridine 2-sulfurtransferase